MKTVTFKDLEFNSHPVGFGGVQAKIIFANGFGASVVGGGMGLRGDGVTSFEVAVIRGTVDKFSLVYDTGITNDVLNYQSKAQVTKVLEKIQKLKKRK